MYKFDKFDFNKFHVKYHFYNIKIIYLFAFNKYICLKNYQKWEINKDAAHQMKTINTCLLTHLIQSNMDQQYINFKTFIILAYQKLRKRWLTKVI